MPGTAKRAAWAEARLLGALRQSVPQNGRVHLHIIEIGSVYDLAARAIRNAIRANRFARIIPN